MEAAIINIPESTRAILSGYPNLAITKHIEESVNIAKEKFINKSNTNLEQNTEQFAQSKIDLLV